MSFIDQSIKQESDGAANHEYFKCLGCGNFLSFRLNRNEFVNFRDGIKFAIGLIRNISIIQEFGWTNNL